MAPQRSSDALINGNWLQEQGWRYITQLRQYIAQSCHACSTGPLTAKEGQGFFHILRSRGLRSATHSTQEDGALSNFYGRPVSIMVRGDVALAVGQISCGRLAQAFPEHGYEGARAFITQILRHQLHCMSLGKEL